MSHSFGSIRKSKYNFTCWASERLAVTNMLDFIPDSVAKIGFVGLVGIGALSFGWKKWFMRYPTINDILPSMWRSKNYTYRGIVTSVSDGDNFRVYHQPVGLIWKRVPEKILAVDSLMIRLAGIDAPECSHFGQPGQPYGEQAKDWLKNELLGSVVRVKLLRRDQYGRAVGMVYRRNAFTWENMSIRMAKNGWAVVYDGSDGEYDDVYEKLNHAVAYAKQRRLGMWKKTANQESPMSYKKRMKSEQ